MTAKYVTRVAGKAGNAEDALRDQGEQGAGNEEESETNVLRSSGESDGSHTLR